MRRRPVIKSSLRCLVARQSRLPGSVRSKPGRVQRRIRLDYPHLPHSARSVEIIEPPTGSPTGMRYELSSKKVFVALRA